MNLDIDDIKEYIMSTYPPWKIRTTYKRFIDMYFVYDDEMGIDEDIEMKISSYEMTNNMEIENKIISFIATSVKEKYKLSIIDREIKDFIFEYMCLCVPSFKDKTHIFNLIYGYNYN